MRARWASLADGGRCPIFSVRLPLVALDLHTQHTPDPHAEREHLLRMRIELPQTGVRADGGCVVIVTS